jgi:DNA ligase-1
MTPFAEFAALCQHLESTRSRLEKRRHVASFLVRIAPDEIPLAVPFLMGRPFPTSEARVLGVRGMPRGVPPAASATLSLGEVGRVFGVVAASTGSGSRRAREEALVALAVRATAAEQEMLSRIVGGEMRTGVSDGLVLEAIGLASGAEPAAVRRAALFLGDLAAVGVLARRGGATALGEAAPRPFVPLLPMLAEMAPDLDAVLATHGGRTALEYKYDGARIQLHRSGDRLAVWTRRLSDVTASLPDVVAIARRDLSGEPFILDGEVVALDTAGRPLPFQDLMRRFRRVHGVEDLVREMPLALHFFDCLMAEGRSLIDEPYQRRWETLTRVTSGRYLAERVVVARAADAEAFHARARADGHEGVMAKDLEAPYEPGGRGKRWFKVKAAETIDCVILAADRGSGRRVGWLSNYHLAVREGEGFAEVGKTFKGFTDQQFVAMTERLWSLSVADDGYTVRVRPEVVVEVAYNEIQTSPTYPSGLALRFARITRVREDKGSGQATTLDELRTLFERQFATKGRRAGAR